MNDVMKQESDVDQLVTAWEPTNTGGPTAYYQAPVKTTTEKHEQKSTVSAAWLLLSDKGNEHGTPPRINKTRKLYMTQQISRVLKQQEKTQKKQRSNYSVKIASPAARRGTWGRSPTPSGGRYRSRQRSLGKGYQICPDPPWKQKPQQHKPRRDTKNVQRLKQLLHQNIREREGRELIALYNSYQISI